MTLPLDRSLNTRERECLHEVEGRIDEALAEIPRDRKVVFRIHANDLLMMAFKGRHMGPDSANPAPERYPAMWDELAERYRSRGWNVITDPGTDEPFIISE